MQDARSLQSWERGRESWWCELDSPWSAQQMYLGVGLDDVRVPTWSPKKVRIIINTTSTLKMFSFYNLAESGIHTQIYIFSSLLITASRLPAFYPTSLVKLDSRLWFVWTKFQRNMASSVKFVSLHLQHTKHPHNWTMNAFYFNIFHKYQYLPLKIQQWIPCSAVHWL